jgi:pimeloyl-ACP methyl ester carboxylesterase
LTDPFQAEEVVLVHGLWMRPWVNALMKRRLMAEGFRVHRFDYRTTRDRFDDSALLLARKLDRCAGTRLNVIAHSLGGLLTVKALGLTHHAQGRAVLLGSPIGGSRVARRLHGWPGGSVLLGQAATVLQQGLADPPPPRWSVGMIAGDRRVGAGLLVGGGTRPGDGTVTLEETRAPFLDAHHILHESHTSLLLSARTHRAAVEYLRQGRFPSENPDEVGEIPKQT